MAEHRGPQPIFGRFGCRTHRRPPPSDCRRFPLMPVTIPSTNHHRKSLRNCHFSTTPTPLLLPDTIVAIPITRRLSECHLNHCLPRSSPPPSFALPTGHHATFPTFSQYPLMLPNAMVMPPSVGDATTHCHPIDHRPCCPLEMRPPDRTHMLTAPHGHRLLPTHSRSSPHRRLRWPSSSLAELPLLLLHVAQLEPTARRPSFPSNPPPNSHGLPRSQEADIFLSPSTTIIAIIPTAVSSSSHAQPPLLCPSSTFSSLHHPQSIFPTIPHGLNHLLPPCTSMSQHHTRATLVRLSDIRSGGGL